MELYQNLYHSDIRITLLDIILILFIILIIFGLKYFALNNKEKLNSSNTNYFYNALIVKVIAGVIFACITLFFYPGDSMAYFRNINCLNRMLFTNSSHYFDIMFHGNQAEYWGYFNNKTGYPASYMWRAPNAMFVVRIFSPFMLLTYKSFLLSNIVASIIGFTGLWKLYCFFSKLYPKLEKKFIYAIIYFPSVLFWSSGLLKDTLTIAAVGWIIYSFNNFAIERKFKIKYLLAIIVASIIIINIKSYIFAALVPGLLVWFFHAQLISIKSKFMRVIVVPFLIIGVALGGSLIFGALSSVMGEYGNVDQILNKAQVTQQDLTRGEQYGENFYDIGEFEPTLAGIVKKIPIATVSGIFRPFIWEATNPFILLAGLESLFMIIFLLSCLVKTRITGFFKQVIQDPILFFAFSFVLIFGFGIGLATGNFGALVRYKIPLLPLFVSGLLIMNHKTRNLLKNKN